MLLHKEILTKEQTELLPLIQKFSEDFILVGGTAIALHIGHRRSIDFDLFSYADFDNKKIKRKILRYSKIDKTYTNEEGQYTLSVNNIKITFFNYLYKIKSSAYLDGSIKIPNLLTLAAMKAFALGNRGKWKDYCSLDEISEKGKQIFGSEFNGRIFREALVYFEDVNYKEEVIYLKGFETDDEVIKKE